MSDMFSNLLGSLNTDQYLTGACILAVIACLCGGTHYHRRRRLRGRWHQPHPRHRHHRGL